VILSYDVVTALEWDFGQGLLTLIHFLMHASPVGRSN
jgi:hypothetical protein